MVKNPPANGGDTGSIPSLGRPLAEGKGNPLQCSCRGSTIGGGAWRPPVHGVAKASAAI